MKVRIDFKKTRGTGYSSKEYEVNDDRHLDNLLNKLQQDESYRKVIGHEKIYSKKMEFSMDDLKKAFNDGRSGSSATFEEWCESYLKRRP